MPAIRVNCDPKELGVFVNPITEVIWQAEQSPAMVELGKWHTVPDKDHQKLTNCSHSFGLKRIKERFLFSKEGFHERREGEVGDRVDPREVEQEGMLKGIFGDFAASREAELAVACSGNGDRKERQGERGEVGFGAVEEAKSGISVEDGVEEREIAEGRFALDGSDTGAGELPAEFLAALATEKREDGLGSGERGGGRGGTDRRRVVLGIRSRLAGWSGGGVKEGFGGREEAARHVRAESGDDMLFVRLLDEVREACLRTSSRIPFV